MHIRKLFKKLFVLWICFTLQIVLVGIYVYFSPLRDTRPVSVNTTYVTFLNAEVKETHRKYYNEKSRVKLGYERSISKYYNLTQPFGRNCYVEGTDVKYMERNSKDLVEDQCVCLSGWHGMDCAQPEVMWRAFLTSKQKLDIRGPRRKPRRLIYLLHTNAHSTIATEIQVNEVAEVVDLFIICDSSKTRSTVVKLNNGWLSQHHRKILYLSSYNANDRAIWDKVRLVVRDLRNDDCFVTTNSDEVLNKRALMYIKLYNNWPQPIVFRLKWVVYGFFWQHPHLTSITAGAVLVGLFNENYHGDTDLFKSDLIVDRNTLKSNKGLTVGDLNHYGGWVCEYCLDAKDILLEIETTYKNNMSSTIISNAKGKLDESYIEDLISGGLYVDSKSLLRRSYRFRDNYYTPEYVLETSWKYDWLLTNIYSKSDEY